MPQCAGAIRRAATRNPKMRSPDPPRSKRNQDNRKQFGTALLRWAGEHDIALENCLSEDIKNGFPQGEDDAFDAAVGLFGMLQVCLGERAPGEPDNEEVREIEGWILGRKS